MVRHLSRHAEYRSATIGTAAPADRIDLRLGNWPRHPGLPADQLLERMIELSLYAEEKLKSG